MPAPDRFDRSLYWWLVLCGFVGGAGGATFSVGVANAAVFELVPVYAPDAVGGASGWIGGIGGAGTLVILPVLGMFVDVYGRAGYARGFVVFVALSAICALISYGLKRTDTSR